MKWVEFIGPSGVGKSSLFKRVLEMRSPEDLWVTPEEALRTAVQKYSTRRKGPHLTVRARRVIKRLLRLKSPQDQGLVAIRELREEALFRVGKRYNLLAYLLLRHCCERDITDAVGKIRKISFYMQHRLQDFMVIDYAGIEDVVVYEDGIISNNVAGISRFYEYGDCNIISDNDDAVLYPFAVIHCVNEPAEICRRIRTRERNGEVRYGHVHMNNDELRVRIVSAIAAVERTLTVLSTNNIPVLKIHTSDELGNNALEVNNFIRDVTACGMS